MKRCLSIFGLVIMLLLSCSDAGVVYAAETKDYFTYDGVDYKYSDSIMTHIEDGKDVMVFAQHKKTNYSLYDQTEIFILLYDGDLYNVGCAVNDNMYYFKQFNVNDSSVSCGTDFIMYQLNIKKDGTFSYSGSSSGSRTAAPSVPVKDTSYSYDYQGYKYTITGKGFLYASTDIYYCDYIAGEPFVNLDKTSAFFVGPLVPLVKIVEKVELGEVMKEIWILLPMAITCLVGYVGLRKALRRLVRILQRA